jgi:DNA-directed RNA polymerase
MDDDDLDEILIKEENKEEIIDFKKIRNLINHFILTYIKCITEPVNNISYTFYIRDLKEKELILLEYTRTIVFVKRKAEDKRRKTLEEIDKIKNEIDKIDDKNINKDKYATYCNLLRDYQYEILNILGKYLSEKDEYQKLDTYHQQNRQSPIIHS